ncbi:hypothetical protein [Sphingomonas paeninsulae]|uniref:hypothetical protein n=1 Tax=Sphingomonas paeninsulae TaxID=2319844 RepID=UPI0013CE8CD6|nr:hypothetical protein [Sphingomonas paeninsulae]
MLRAVSFLTIFCVASPALAFGSVEIPEPGEFGLFALGVVGLIIGRHVSRRP